LEFNPEAEKFFGIKREDAVNRNYIQMFIPEPERKKTEKDLEKLLTKSPVSKFKMHVLSAGGNILEVDWSASILQDNLNKPTGIILTLKR
jgi:PAS domain S-box-containing protein